MFILRKSLPHSWAPRGGEKTVPLSQKKKNEKGGKEEVKRVQPMPERKDGTEAKSREERRTRLSHVRTEGSKNSYSTLSATQGGINDVGEKKIFRKGEKS